MPVQYPDTFRKEVVRRYEVGETIKALSQELHVSQSTLYRWRKEYRTIQAPGHSYTPADFDALSRRLQKAEHELESHSTLKVYLRSASAQKALNINRTLSKIG